MPTPRPLTRRTARLVVALATWLTLAAPAVAQVPLEPEASFGSSLSGDGRFQRPGGVATDDAGRVYVADTAAGRIEVYDSAADGNELLGTVGADVLRCPVGVRIDNRGRIYAADACRDVVVMFDSLTDRATVRREFGGTGTSVGRMWEPRFVAVDHAARVYVAERANARVQSWRPSGGRQAPVAAFGVADPRAFGDPEGIARDRQGRIYVSGAGPGGGEVRLYDARGQMLGVIAGSGTAPGQVSAPRGLERDPAGRLLVADGGNARLQVLAPPASGFAPLAATAAGVLERPVDAALAPGALLYVVDAGTGRVVRIRYDDADRDGALDARDVCPGLADPLQRDADRDGRGDECDEDDDGDGVGDAGDRCPQTRRGTDGNGDGCGDPRSRISSPRHRRTYPRSRPPARFSGSAAADELGVERVEVALALVRGRRCHWHTGTGFGPAAACDAPSAWLPAAGAARWAKRMRLRRRGTYRMLSRAVQVGGLVEARFDRRNLRIFRIR